MAEALSAQLQLDVSQFTAGLQQAAQQAQQFATALTTNVQQAAQAFAALSQSQTQSASQAQSQTQATNQLATAYLALATSIGEQTQAYTRVQDAALAYKEQQDALRESTRQQRDEQRAANDEANRTADVWRNAASVLAGLGIATTIGGIISSIKSLVAGTLELVDASVKGFGALSEGILKIGAQVADFDKTGGFQRIADQIHNVAISTGKDTQDVSKALFELYSVWGDSEKAAAILEASSKLAVGGFTDLTTATRVVSAVMAAFKLDADDAGKVANALFVAARQGRTDFDSFGKSIAPLLPTLATFRGDLRDAGAVLATVTPLGFSASEAVTGLNRTLTAIAAPTVRNIQLFKDLKESLGIDISLKRDEQGFIDFVATYKQLEGLSPEILRRILGSEEALIQVRQLITNLETMRKNIEDSHTTIDEFGAAYKRNMETAGQLIKEATQAQKAYGDQIGQEVAQSAEYHKALEDRKQAFLDMTTEVKNHGEALGHLAAIWENVKTSAAKAQNEILIGFAEMVLKINEGANAVTAGLSRMWTMVTTGKDPGTAAEQVANALKKQAEETAAALNTVADAEKNVAATGAVVAPATAEATVTMDKLKNASQGVVMVMSDWKGTIAGLDAQLSTFALKPEDQLKVLQKELSATEKTMADLGDAAKATYAAGGDVSGVKKAQQDLQTGYNKETAAIASIKDAIDAKKNAEADADKAAADAAKLEMDREKMVAAVMQDGEKAIKTRSDLLKDLQADYKYFADKAVEATGREKLALEGLRDAAAAGLQKWQDGTAAVSAATEKANQELTTMQSAVQQATRDFEDFQLGAKNTGQELSVMTTDLKTLHTDVMNFIQDKDKLGAKLTPDFVNDLGHLDDAVGLTIDDLKKAEASKDSAFAKFPPGLQEQVLAYQSTLEHLQAVLDKVTTDPESWANKNVQKELATAIENVVTTESKLGTGVQKYQDDTKKAAEIVAGAWAAANKTIVDSTELAYQKRLEALDKLHISEADKVEAQNQLLLAKTKELADKQQAEYVKVVDAMAKPIESIFQSIVDKSGSLIDTLKKMFFTFLEQLAAKAAAGILINIAVNALGTGTTSDILQLLGVSASTANAALGSASATGSLGASIGGAFGSTGSGGGGFGSAATIGGSVLSIASKFIPKDVFPNFLQSLGMGAQGSGNAAAGTAGIGATAGSSGSNTGFLSNLVSQYGTGLASAGAGIVGGLIGSYINGIIWGGQTTAQRITAGVGGAGGAIGGAIVGTAFGPVGTIVGAGLGALLGTVAGGALGSIFGAPKPAQLDIFKTQPGQVSFDEKAQKVILDQPLQILDSFARRWADFQNTLLPKLQTQLAGLSNDLVNNFQQLDPAIQQRLTGPLNNIFAIIADALDKVHFKGDDTFQKLNRFFETDLPKLINEITQPLLDTINKISPVIAALRDRIPKLEAYIQQLKDVQAQFDANIDAELNAITGGKQGKAPLDFSQQLGVMWDALQKAWDEFTQKLPTLSTQDILAMGKSLNDFIMALADGAIKLRDANSQLIDSLDKQIASYGVQKTEYQTLIENANALNDALSAFAKATMSGQAAMTPAIQGMADSILKVTSSIIAAAAQISQSIGQQIQTIQQGQLSAQQVYQQDVQKASQLWAAIKAEQDPIKQLDLIKQFQQAVTEGLQAAANAGIKGADLQALQNAVVGGLQQLQGIADQTQKDAQKAQQDTLDKLGDVKTTLEDNNKIIDTALGVLATQLQQIKDLSDAAFSNMINQAEDLKKAAQDQIDKLADTILGIGNVDDAVSQGNNILSQIDAVLGTQNSPDNPAINALQQQIALLKSIDFNIQNIAKGIANVQPTGPPANPPPLQEGTSYVPHTGSYQLHQGEMVIPADDAAAVLAVAGHGLESVLPPASAIPPLDIDHGLGASRKTLPPDLGTLAPPLTDYPPLTNPTYPPLTNPTGPYPPLTNPVAPYPPLTNPVEPYPPLTNPYPPLVNPSPSDLLIAASPADLSGVVLNAAGMMLTRAGIASPSTNWSWWGQAGAGNFTNSASTGGGSDTITINVYPGPGMNEENLANLVVQRMAREARYNSRRTGVYRPAGDGGTPVPW